MELTKGIVILITLVFLSSLVLPSIAVPEVSKEKIEKDFITSTKTLILKNDTKPLLEVRQVSIKEGVCQFEEVFEVTAINEDYTPSKDKDFKLGFKNKEQEDAKHKIGTEEWFVWEDDKWEPLKWDVSHRTKKIKNGETRRYKVVVTKQAELGNKRILTIPSFMGVEDERLSWWNASWQYKINSVLDDVPVGGYTYNLTVHSSSGTNNQTDVFLNGLNATNFMDMRFVLDSTTELNYWVEDNSTDPIKVWVNVTDNGVVGLYYGNPYVGSVSNGTNTFVQFQEDLTTNHLGTLEFNGDHAFHGKIERISGSDNKLEVGFASLLEHKPDNGAWIYFYQTVNQSASENKKDDNITSTNIGNKALGIYYVDINYISETSIIFYLNGSQQGSVHTTNLSTINMGMFFYEYNGESKLYWGTIRKYLFPEPLWSTWSERLSMGAEVDSALEYNTQRKLARTSEGYLHRVYTKFDGSNYHVYYARSIDSGSTWIETILTGVGVNNTHPTIASDSEDNLWVVYEREGSGIRYRKYGGLSWETEQTLSSDSGEVPVIAVDSEDNVYAVWYNDLLFEVIIWTKYNGSSWSARSADVLGILPSLAVDTNNYLHVVYQKWNATSNTYNIKHEKYTDSWQPVYNITSGETYNQTYPCIAADLSGNVHIVWQTQDYQIKSIKYEAAGSWEAIKTVHDGGIYEQRNPSVSVYSDNYVYATWFGKTATYNESYIIRESNKTTGSWSGALDILHPSGKDVVYPNSISVLYPVICGDCYLNIPLTGYSFVYDEEGAVKYYNASTWRCEEKYVIKIKARDTETNDYITNFTVDFSAGETKTTDDGLVKYTCLDSGYYDVTVSSSDYHSAQQSVVLDQNKELIVYLTPISETDYFLPEIHEVRFMVVDGYGAPVEDVTVTATCIETTLGSWDLLMEFFGFKNVTTIQNTTMTGTTDSGGEIVFPMVKTVKYQITFVKGSDINKTLTTYPIDDKYVIRVGTFWDSIKDWFSASKEDQLLGEQVSWNITTEIINDTHAWIYLDYNDTLSKTTNQYFFVNDSNNTNLYNVSASGECVWNPGYIVENYSGQSYLVGFEIIHDDIGEIKKIVVVTFKHVVEKLVDFGWDDSIYQLVSVALLIFAAALFTGVTVKHAAVMLPLEGWVFWYIGWFEISIILLSIATSIGIGVYVIERGHETHVSS